MENIRQKSEGWGFQSAWVETCFYLKNVHTLSQTSVRELKINVVPYDYLRISEENLQDIGKIDWNPIQMKSNKTSLVCRVTIV